MKHETKQIKFAVFADLHYKKGMRIETVEDLKAIMKRAHENQVDFVLQAGDMSNDCRRSPELYREYLTNPYGLPVYGTYGNHEMESENNSMQEVTPKLTNRDVVWGTADGKIGDGSVGYYHADFNGFRIVAIDTNYSWNPTEQIWEHNRTNSHGIPAGNEKVSSLGPVQLGWLKDVLQDAADKDLHCVLLSHAAFSGAWGYCSDQDTLRALIREVNERKPGTVLMALNGHHHSNHQAVIEDVIYVDVNTARDGLWNPKGEKHYDGFTYKHIDFDAEGNEISRYDRPVDETWFSKTVWYFAEPLSAIVTLSSDGSATIEGAETTWFGGVDPHTTYTEPKISDGKYPSLADRAKAGI